MRCTNVFGIELDCAVDKPFLIQSAAWYESDMADVVVVYVKPGLPPDSIFLWHDLEYVSTVERQGSLSTRHWRVFCRVVAKQRPYAYLPNTIVIIPLTKWYISNSTHTKYHRNF